MSATNVTALPSLISRLLRETRELFTTELAMAKKEVAENLSLAGAALVFVAAALLFALVAIHALAVAAVLVLIDFGIPMGWGALIVCGAFALLATIFGLMARRRLSVSALAPNRTFDNLKTDLETLEGTINADRKHDTA